MTDMARTSSRVDVDSLRAGLTGEVIGPDDEGYDRHRLVFNQRIDCTPAAIVRCRSRDDVVRALDFRARHSLPVAVRCGSTSGYSTLDGGIVIDVSPMKSMNVDAKAGIARVGAGLTWAEMDAATQKHGLATTGARLSGLGVSGVTLEGGSGWLERSLGPTCQSLVGAEIVFADGRVEIANRQQNPDLLWALRGGGGNFGVVTELEFRIHRVGPTLVAGFLTYPRERAAEVAGCYRDYMNRAPEEVGGGLLLSAGLGGGCTIAFCFVGSIEDGEKAAAPLRELRPSLNAVAPNEYRAFQSMIDRQNPYGMRAHLRGGFLRDLSDAALESAITAANEPAASLSHVLLQPLGGAMSRVKRNELALHVPEASWAYQCVGLWPPLRSLDQGNIAWVNGFCERMKPFALGVGLPSLVAEEGGDDLVTSFDPENYRMLQRLKGRYDPDNVFRRNHNIEPPE